MIKASALKKTKETFRCNYARIKATTSEIVLAQTTPDCRSYMLLYYIYQNIETLSLYFLFNKF